MRFVSRRRGRTAVRVATATREATRFLNRGRSGALVLGLAAAAALAVPASASASASNDPSPVVGHVYVNDNTKPANTIGAFDRHADTRAAAGALRALDQAGRVLLVAGTLLPLLLLAAAVAGVFAPPLMALGGLLAALCGAWLKLVIVTRAGFNQGFALAHMPVRGTRA